MSECACCVVSWGQQHWVLLLLLHKQTESLKQNHPANVYTRTHTQLDSSFVELRGNDWILLLLHCFHSTFLTSDFASFFFPSGSNQRLFTLSCCASRRFSCSTTSSIDFPFQSSTVSQWRCVVRGGDTACLPLTGFEREEEIVFRLVPPGWESPLTIRLFNMPAASAAIAPDWLARL